MSRKSLTRKILSCAVIATMPVIAYAQSPSAAQSAAHTAANQAASALNAANAGRMKNAIKWEAAALGNLEYAARNWSVADNLPSCHQAREYLRASNYSVGADFAKWCYLDLHDFPVGAAQKKRTAAGPTPGLAYAWRILSAKSSVNDALIKSKRALDSWSTEHPRNARSWEEQAVNSLVYAMGQWGGVGTVGACNQGLSEMRGYHYSSGYQFMIGCNRAVNP